MPKFMLMYISGGTDWSQMTPEEMAKAQRAVMDWWTPLRESGRVVSEGKLHEAGRAKTVRRGADGRISVTDGPFVESKEQIGGYAIVDVADRRAAVEIARTSPFLETMEIRPLVEERDKSSQPKETT